MGMYTMFRFTGQLKDCFVKDIERLNNIKEPYSWKDFAEEHDFAKNYIKLERANLIPFSYMSTYNKEKNPSAYESIVYGLGSDGDYHYTWTFCCDFKNYCSEIETFLRDIAPNICCKFVAIEWYEEYTFPKIYTFCEKTEDNFAPVIHSNWRAEYNPNYSPFDSTMDSEVYFCNNCHNKQYKMSNYCPDCGARMDKVVK